MSKKMTREQEQAMFAKQSTGRTYTKEYQTTSMKTWEDIAQQIKENGADGLSAEGYTFTMPGAANDHSVEVKNPDGSISQHVSLAAAVQQRGIRKADFVNAIDEDRLLIIGDRTGYRYLHITNGATDAYATGFTSEDEARNAYYREISKAEKLNAPPLDVKPVVISGSARFVNGRLITPKQEPTSRGSHTLAKSRAPRANKPRTERKERAYIDADEKAGKTTYTVYASDHAEIVQDGFATKKEAIKFARSNGFAFNRKKNKEE